MNNLRDNLKRYISYKGISVYALEKKAGLRQSTLQNIMQGRSKRPRIDILQAIANELDCTLDDLLDGENSSVKKEVHISQQSDSSSVPWNPELFFEATDATRRILEKKRIQMINKDFALLCIDQIYTYSLSNHEKKLDMHFAEWFIEEGLKRLKEQASFSSKRTIDFWEMPNRS